MAPPELISLSVSPFSWRAKWALDAVGVKYQPTKFIVSPFYLMELPLRLRLRQFTGKITAPILIVPPEKGGAGRRVIMDSDEIARWAAAQPRGAPEAGQAVVNLFPAEHAAETDRWLAATDQLLSLFRRELAAAGMAHQAVRDSMLPPGLSGLSRAGARYIIASIFKMLATKYKEQDAAATADKVLEDLRAVRKQLAAGGGPAGSSDAFLIPTGLSYADMALATALTKLNELNTTSVPAGDVAQQQSPAAAAAGGAADAAAPAAAADGRVQVASLCGPDARAVLAEAADLVEWAAQLIEKHWPQRPKRVGAKKPAAA